MQKRKNLFFYPAVTADVIAIRHAAVMCQICFGCEPGPQQTRVSDNNVSWTDHATRRVLNNGLLSKIIRVQGARLILNVTIRDLEEVVILP